MTREKRKRSRVEISLQVKVYVNGQKIETLTQNISLKGILCAHVHGVEAGQHCQVQLELPSQISMKFKGKVVWSNSRGTAIDFLSMDSESFGHLYNLVRLYAEDADAIEEELLTPAFDVND